MACSFRDHASCAPSAPSPTSTPPGEHRQDHGRDDRGQLHPGRRVGCPVRRAPAHGPHAGLGLHGLLTPGGDSCSRVRERTCTTRRPRPLMQRQILGGQTFEAGLNPVQQSAPHGAAVRSPRRPATRHQLPRLDRHPAPPPGRGAGPAPSGAGEHVVAGRTPRHRRLAHRLPGPRDHVLPRCVLARACRRVLGTYLALVGRRDRIGGLALVVASIKPQGMAGAAVAVLVGRRWDAVASAALAGGVLVVLATVVLGRRYRGRVPRLPRETTPPRSIGTASILP